MSRQRAATTKKVKGLFGREHEVTLSRDEQLHADRQNQMVNDAESYLQNMPERVRNIPGAREVVDTALYAKYLPTDPRVQQAVTIGVPVAGALGLAGSALQAHHDQQKDYLPTGPLSVAGRMVSNLSPFNGSGAVGVDSLAEARNKVSDARKIVGTENMLEALAADEIMQMRGEAEMAMTPTDYGQMAGVQQMIDKRAQQLMGQPIQKSDGSVAPMPFDTAQRLATEQVAMELRAGDVY